MISSRRLNAGGWTIFSEVIYPVRIPTHPNFVAWRRRSITIRKWLIRQLSREVREKLKEPRDDILEYADDAYDAIRRLILRHDNVLCKNTFTKLIDMRRSHYSTVTRYVTAYRRAYIDAQELECGITPYCAVLQMLRQLEGDFPTWVDVVQCSLPDDARVAFTDADFFKLCGVVIAKDDRLSLDRKRGFGEGASQVAAG
ncbi:hypothetical protein ASPBRDRAFT_33452 [Aspergillus brasiliensis CBS 101740]|uniref:Uncharacterized protein n=1 Tax=Aspergillus brasiliensis (strain CBS 101740 / IMI 381727 / IBT 21946) TaxID=767769 RepID=A0A1L9U937_ASPBC|nr:hypothetical protein ASPBRDRAFT_33452 [Aspergillus brasiliensis CBS 101740]